MTEDRKFFQSLKICPACKKERLYGDEKECLSCRTIKYAYCRNFRKKHPGYDKDRRRNEYMKRSEKHQCTACGIQLEEDYQFKMCPKCLNRNKINLRRSRAARGCANAK